MTKLLLPRAPRRHKYRAVATEVDGIRFPSKREAKRWTELKILEQKGHIKNLKRQVRFPIEVNGTVVCTYIADFVYDWAHGDGTVVEDSKPVAIATPVFKLKSKLMRAVHGIEVKCV